MTACLWATEQQFASLDVLQFMVAPLCKRNGRYIVKSKACVWCACCLLAPALQAYLERRHGSGAGSNSLEGSSTLNPPPPPPPPSLCARTEHYLIPNPSHLGEMQGEGEGGWCEIFSGAMQGHHQRPGDLLSNNQARDIRWGIR